MNVAASPRVPSTATTPASSPPAPAADDLPSQQTPASVRDRDKGRRGQRAKRPRHKDTPRQFECTRLITAEQVKSVLKHIPGFRNNTGAPLDNSRTAQRGEGS